MSLAIRKFADGESPEVRIYKRGNDEVDLNAFVRQAEAGFNDWLDKADIKDKHKKEVRAAYQDMITRINDDPESFVARLGGGFTNTAGITNKTKGFDAYGVAAGYLGNTLRGMSAYTKPEVKSYKSKYKRDAGFITSKMQNQIWGDNPESFIRLDDDSYDENTGQRGITNRVAQTVAGLKALKERLKDYYDFDSDEDYNHAIGRIDSAIASLQNANPNDDWFILGQLGITGVDKFLYTGQERSISPRSREEQAQFDQYNDVRNFENYMSSYRPFYTGQLASIPIGSRVGSANEQQKTELRSKLASLSKDDIRNWLLSYIVDPNYDFSQYSTLRRVYGGLPTSGLFTNAQYISGILEQALEVGELKNISGTNTYYIPSTLEEYPDKSSTIYIYDADTQTFSQVDTQDVPDYRKQYLNEYRQSHPSSYQGNSAYRSRYPEMYPSHKEGGILKFQNSGKFIGNIGHTDNYSWYKNGLSNWIDQLISDGIKATDKNAFAKLVNDTQHSHSQLAKVWDGERAYFGTDNSVGNYQKGINDNFAYVNKNGISSIKSNNYYLYPSGANTSDKGDSWTPDNYYSAQTDDRRILGREGDYNPVQLQMLIDRWRQAGYRMYLDDADKYYKLEAQLPEELQDIRLETEQEILTNPELGEIPKPKAQPDSVELDEASIGTKSPRGTNLAQNLTELGTDLLGVGRLIGSINANNRIARTVRDSLRPKLHDTYELYSPVTGAFGEMQLRNRQGAETLSQSYRPFTSDASLASARMLEGQRQANDLQYQGFLADDREIRRTQAEALQRQEGNIARRSALANENRDAIIANNQAVAQLEASRIKQNWNSIDNYLQGVEGSIRERLNYQEALKRREELEDKYDRRNYERIQDQRFNASQYQPELEQIDKLIAAWEEANPTKSKEKQSWYKSVYERKTELADRLREDNLYSMAQRRGWEATNKYRQPGKYYDPALYNWETIIRRDGGTLKLSSSQLIDKIIKKNEGNS